MKHKKHISCLGGAYLWDYGVCDTSVKELFRNRACFQSVDEEAFSRLGIILYFDFLHILLGFEILDWEGFDEM